MTTFFRLLDVPVDQKASVLRDSLRTTDRSTPERAAPDRVFDRSPAVFGEVPGAPFAYWISEKVRAAFTSHEKFESSDRAVRHGAATLDDFRFLRTWWEPAGTRTNSWPPFAKGGATAPFYVDIPLCLNWNAEGKEVKAFVAAKVGSASRTIQATEFYFRPGLTWP